MKDKLILGIIAFFIAVFIFSSPAYAASNVFFTKAQKYASKICNARNVSNESSLVCYLNEKVKEHDTAISEQDVRISELEDRVAELENQNVPAPTSTTTPTPSPTPTESPTPTP